MPLLQATQSKAAILGFLALTCICVLKADQAPVPPRPKELVGTWRIFSQRLFYDKGGGGVLLSAAKGTASTQVLELRENGDWRFGESQGQWSVATILDEDWKRWGIKSYGPQRKIALTNWKGAPADGLIEESSQVDFLWVLYHVEPPTSQASGTVHMKLGRTKIDSASPKSSRDTGEK